MLTEGEMYMKEMLHSKVLVGFIIFVLGFTYVNSIRVNKMDYGEDSYDKSLYLSQNIIEGAI